MHKEFVPAYIDHFCDGDTVVMIARCQCCTVWQTVTVRIAGIDSHEPEGPTKILAQQIADRWTAKLKNKLVELRQKQSHTDIYGRIIGDVIVDGEPLFKMLVESGDAWYI